ncbi:MAG: trehalose utilization protein ThuA [Candidatus Melainabacteria bacterium HGW-Melainabacteria-1]|nr:MAG: trehalose utilization protein ThuA [Candidatus Melainabacteria bacterium HGW-Melainabacteria-1]
MGPKHFPRSLVMSTNIRVLVWDENGSHVPAALYPQGIRGAVAACLAGDPRLQVLTGHLDQPEQGLATLDQTDVLLWWGHLRHAELEVRRAIQITAQIRQGTLGLIALHSAHHSQVFQRALSCSGDLGSWREDDKPEMIRVCAPQHPIAAGVEDFTLAGEEMYASPFAVPPPECVVLQSWFPAGGEFFPSGLTWRAGAGKVFYFRPGHETCPSYHHPNVGLILRNAVAWAAPLG